MLTGFPAAQRLFHRAIIMSTLPETAVTGLRPERAVEAAELLLQVPGELADRRRLARAVDPGDHDHGRLVREVDLALAGAGGVGVVENVGEGVAVGVDQGAGLAVERAQVLAPQV